MNCLLVFIAFNIFGAICSAKTVVASWKTEGLTSVWFFTTKHPKEPIQKYTLEKYQKKVSFTMDDPNQLEGAVGEGKGRTFHATITDPLDEEKTVYHIRLVFSEEGQSDPCVIC